MKHLSIVICLTCYLGFLKAEEAVPAQAATAAKAVPAAAVPAQAAPAQAVPAQAVPATAVPAVDQQGKKKMAKKKKTRLKQAAKVDVAPTPAPAGAAPAGAAPASAAPAQKDSLQAWLQKLKKRIAQTKSKPNKLVAVAAVRGDEAKDPVPLYWKGKKTESAVSNKEVKAFDEALDVALSGDKEAAKSKLTSFISTYPKSPLMGEAKDTLAKLDEH